MAAGELSGGDDNEEYFLQQGKFATFHGNFSWGKEGLEML